jgi:RNase P subunit RPR2
VTAYFMELFEELPRVLKSKSTGKTIAFQIQQRLTFQWKAMHKMASSALELSHNLCRQFFRLSNEHIVDLPTFVTEKICTYCGSFLLPAVSCRVRLKSLQRSKTIHRSELVVTCLQCMKISRREEVKRVMKANKVDDSTTPTAQHDIPTLSKKFSFSNVLSKGTLQGDFIPLESKPNNTITLLDMERDYKKKRKYERDMQSSSQHGLEQEQPARKPKSSLQVQVFASNVGTLAKSTTASKSHNSSSLIALKNMFMNKK